MRRALRAAGLSPLKAKGIGLHSAKRTILTWAGSSGIFTDRELEVLGHHRSAGIGKVVCAYNVTVLAAPVTKLRQLLEHIVQGAFNPDAPAGMQWREGTYPVGQPASPAPAAAPSHTAPGPPANASAAASADGQASTGAAPTPQPALARNNQSAAQPPAHAAAAAQVHSPTGRAPLDHAAPPSVPHPVESRAPGGGCRRAAARSCHCCPRRGRGQPRRIAAPREQARVPRRRVHRAVQARCV